MGVSQASPSPFTTFVHVIIIMLVITYEIRQLNWISELVAPCAINYAIVKKIEFQKSENLICGVARAGINSEFAEFAQGRGFFIRQNS